MNKKIYKIVSLLLCVVLAFCVAPSVKSEAANKKTLEKKTVYLASKNGSVSTSVRVDGLTKISKLKSSNKNVRIYGYSTYSNSSQYYYADINGNFVPSTYSGGNNNKYIDINATSLKPGYAEISFTSGKTNYVAPVTFLGYQNPLASLKITNVSGGKNMASKFANSSYVSNRFKVTKGGVIKVNATAANGWEITYISLNNRTNNSNDNYSIYRNYANAVTKASVAHPEYNNKKDGYVGITLRNKKNGGTMHIGMNLAGTASTIK
ncbi:hypothetical protein [Butyrivibrio sp. YAB3001]|uniref:hypothetical protein n=1 Tax=Butyrivibrio sp. YAB3001 TaxID=1520812 RepID=UPI0008F62D73|nr:hypothetical protein [Butyrivibrio sp. YAB3001]SFB73021.1 hypothetical protein SAMN02910398_00483 [Butyrivibrio sp. YAB3001]